MNHSYLKYIAVASMLIDHIGVVFFPHLIIFRVIGRLAMPIFAGELALGYDRTHDFGAYLRRLFILAVVSQLPFGLAYETSFLNIVFSLCCALVFLRLTDKGNNLAAVFFLAVIFFLPLDSGWVTMLWAYVFRRFGNSNKWAAFLAASFFGLTFAFFSGFFVFAFSFLGVACFLFLPKANLPLSLHRHFFYWFYPLHFLLLYLVKCLFII